MRTDPYEAWPASALALLTPEQKELGALVIDNGGGTTEYVVYGGGVICVPNQKLFKLVDEKTSMVEMFAITHDAERWLKAHNGLMRDSFRE